MSSRSHHKLQVCLAVVHNCFIVTDSNNFNPPEIPKVQNKIRIGEHLQLSNLLVQQIVPESTVDTQRQVVQNRLIIHDNMMNSNIQQTIIEETKENIQENEENKNSSENNPIFQPQIFHLNPRTNNTENLQVQQLSANALASNVEMPVSHTIIQQQYTSQVEENKQQNQDPRCPLNFKETAVQSNMQAHFPLKSIPENSGELDANDSSRNQHGLEQIQHQQQFQNQNSQDLRLNQQQQQQFATDVPKQQFDRAQSQAIISNFQFLNDDRNNQRPTEMQGQSLQSRISEKSSQFEGKSSIQAKPQRVQVAEVEINRQNVEDPLIAKQNENVQNEEIQEGEIQQVQIQISYKKVGEEHIQNQEQNLNAVPVNQQNDSKVNNSDMVKLDITKYVEIQGIGKKEQMLSISLRWGGGRLAIFKYY